MDAPVTRTKQQVIDFYSGVLSEAFDLSQSQEGAVRAMLIFACTEMEDRADACAAAPYAKLRDELVDAKIEVDRLKNANAEAEEQIGRLCSELQELKTKPVASIQINGTEPEPEPLKQAAATPAAPVGPRKRGPYKKKGATLDEIAQQLEGDVASGAPSGAPSVGRIDRSLISDDSDQVTLNGKLRREESAIVTQHGMPVRVTRQYIELR